MLPLRDMQRQFVAVLFDELHEADVPWLYSGSKGPLVRGARRARTAARVAVYRNNLHEGFLKALTLEFPVIERLVGADYFRQLAREFMRAHPSQSGDLHPIGARFPQYLSSRFAGSDYGYLPDIAALEWAYQQAASAADAPPLDPRLLAAVAPERYGELRFMLHPACFLTSSEFPILRIWQVNQAEGEPDTVDLSAGPDHVITRRMGEGVELRRIPPAEYVFVDRLSHGATLTEAFEGATEVDCGFELGAALRKLLALGLIIGFRTNNNFLAEGVQS